jgi:phosphatidate phosphatase PAH1
MIFVIDIDGTICISDNDYDKSIPRYDRIQKINKLYDEGHTIKYFTARGMGRYKDSRIMAHQDFYELTYNQLKSWDCKFHYLIMGKPAGDIYIDDKGMHDDDFFN